MFNEFKKAKNNANPNSSLPPSEVSAPHEPTLNDLVEPPKQNLNSNNSLDEYARLEEQISKECSPLQSPDQEHSKPPEYTTQHQEPIKQNPTDELQLKINDLNTEIDKFKNENDKLKGIKIEYESQLKSFTGKIEEIEMQKEQEISKLICNKDSEIKALQKEKKEFEKKIKVDASVPNNKFKEEIEQLQKELNNVKEETKQKDIKAKASLDKIKKKNEELEAQNLAYKNEIRQLELLRLQQWNANKEITMKASQPKHEIFKSLKQGDIKVNTNVVTKQTKPHEDIIQKVNFSEFELELPSKYHNIPDDKLIEEKEFENGKKARTYASGKKEFLFSNGVRKELFPDKYNIVYFANKDIKQCFPDGKMMYYFAEAKTTQTTMPSGLQIFKFQSNQIEKHYPDGKKEIM